MAGLQRGILAAVATVLLASSSASADRTPSTVAFETHVIDHFQIADPSVVRFQDLVFRGGLEVESASRAVGGLSGLVMRNGGASFIAISDDGLVLQADVLRDGAGRPVGLSNGRMEPLTASNGEPVRSKIGSDTESLDIVERDGKEIARLSLEGFPRVIEGEVRQDGFFGRMHEVRIHPGARNLRASKGLESLALGRPGGPFEGSTVVIAERPPRTLTVEARPGWLFGGRVEGRFLLTDDDFDITDAKFGPGDDLFVLERAFTIGDGVRARIRRVAAAELVPGALINGRTIFEASLAHQIDNMEGLAIWTEPSSGKTMISLISDDNRSFLQRTLYLEFELIP
ncbi:esterase-like activity of phytase family protein [Chthonobacter albigriseus]|uniref:esterase-like activity of phytase family protein n=1 Tax=Chthonobacter albigriseus TaxID=1683161 RepID=UPI0015EF4975|nr:esterase-like activity of phytase family protein [Chthonobacter albigriseus]